MKYKKVWFTSDTHLCHDNIIKYKQNRFKYKSVNDMNNDIIKIWNGLVKPDDIVFILGDFIWSTGDYTAANKLNGKKILVMGNHDRDRAKLRNKAGVLEVFDRIDTIICGQQITMSHYPFRYSVFKSMFHTVKTKIKQFFTKRKYNYHVEKRPLDEGQILLHGHIHSDKQTCIRKRMIDVGWDAWGRPVNLCEIESSIQKITMENK